MKKVCTFLFLMVAQNNVRMNAQQPPPNYYNLQCVLEQQDNAQHGYPAFSLEEVSLFANQDYYEVVPAPCIMCDVQPLETHEQPPHIAMDEKDQ